MIVVNIFFSPPTAKQILPREDIRQPHRWHTQSTTRGKKIITWLAIADLLASLGVFVRSMVWLSSKDLMPAVGGSTSILFCAITSAWVQYFYTATWIWTLCYALDMRLFLKDRPGHPYWYHAASWVLPAFTTTVGLSLLYLPDAKCHSVTSLASALARILPNYCATYLPIVVVMVVNPVLYMLSLRDVQLVVASGMGQYTGKERSQVDAVRLRFALINLAFYLCWLPNLVNGALLWALWIRLPHQVVILFWYIMAVVNPLQALLNSLVYNRWGDAKQRVHIPFRRLRPRGSASSSEPSAAREAAVESTPLVGGDPVRPRAPINGSSRPQR
ncbi:G-protein coupled receptor 143-like [Bacillus rossius redtenbacheri]|uniref:G-protein coupled receptor 143-like n=1 Tax=Bacillus rossius redtenbacheri TaxID=93214 RepID=UPI002FDD13D3